MKIKFFCPIWGSDKLDFRSFVEKVSKSGYNGVEMSLPEDPEEKLKIALILKDYGLELIAQHWETLTSDYKLHLDEYRRRLVNLAKANPLFINSQTGKDYFSFERNSSLIEIADQVSREYNTRIIHETHRGKFSFAPHITAGYLEKLPHLRLGLDISHWFNVAESWLDDQQTAVNMALGRTDHIHARVGFPEGPQVPDPRASEWKEALDHHTQIWSNVLDRRREEGWSEFTITSEFGPRPYMTIIPSTGKPIADQWDINVFMMNHLKSAFRGKSFIL
jgi:sugar phosphate isomerase/epimerase